MIPSRKMNGFIVGHGSFCMLDGSLMYKAIGADKVVMSACGSLLFLLLQILCMLSC